MSDEASRPRALTGVGILAAAPDETFDLITETAQNLFGVPMAAVTFIDETRQWMKSAWGLPREDAPLKRKASLPGSVRGCGAGARQARSAVVFI